MLLVSVVFMLGLSSCQLLGWGDDGTEWTIMLWLDGDNNLNPEAVLDYHELAYGLHLAQQQDRDITDKLKIIVFYDQSAIYDGSSSSPGIYEVSPDGAANTYGSSVSPPHSDLVESIFEPNMGSPENLGIFIDYCKEYYQAENYGLILWNHGGGVRSFKEQDSISREICVDEDIDVTSNSDALYVGEIKDYLDSSHSVDFLGMDACLMGFMEVAYEFRPDTGDFGADAICFSPATEQGDGWEYDQILSRIAGIDDPYHPDYDLDSLTAKELASIVAQEYEDAFSSYPYQTQTAIDLTKIETLKSELDQFSYELRNSQLAAEATYRDTEGIPYFDTSDAYEWYAYAGFDLYELARSAYMDLSIESDLEAASLDLMAALQDAILHSWAGSGYTGFDQGKNGLAIFFPKGDTLYPGETNTYWSYQHWYNGVSRSEYEAWWGASAPMYGGLDICTSDGDRAVESWFELLQYWFNPATSSPNNYNPSPLW